MFKSLESKHGVPCNIVETIMLWCACMYKLNEMLSSFSTSERYFRNIYPKYQLMWWHLLAAIGGSNYQIVIRDLLNLVRSIEEEVESCHLIWVRVWFLSGTPVSSTIRTRNSRFSLNMAEKQQGLKEKVVWFLKPDPYKFLLKQISTLRFIPHFQLQINIKTHMKHFLNFFFYLPTLCFWNITEHKHFILGYIQNSKFQTFY